MLKHDGVAFTLVDVGHSLVLDLSESRFPVWFRSRHGIRLQSEKGPDGVDSTVR